MQVRLTNEKATKLKTACQELLTEPQTTIRQVASVIGLLVSSFPGVALEPLYYRMLEADKTAVLLSHKGDFDKRMSLSLPAREELEWWINNVHTASNPVQRAEPTVTLKTDAFKLGWGGIVQEHSTGGLWSVGEATERINYLEMLAVFLQYGKHVMVKVDNTTAECVIRQMGTSHGSKLNTLAKAIWQWCTEHNIWITMGHILGQDNVQADKESRVFNLNMEWRLSNSIFKLGCQKLAFTPNIDLFASRINHQLKPYVSYRPDPEAIAVNAFHISWTQYSFYAFPPFSVIMHVLRKIQEDRYWGYGNTELANPSVVDKSHGYASPTASFTAKKQTHTISTQSSRTNPSSAQKTLPHAVPLVGQQLKEQGFSTTAARVIQSSWK